MMQKSSQPVIKDVLHGIMTLYVRAGLSIRFEVGVDTVLCKSNANEFRRISFFVLANFRAKLRVKFRKFHAKSFTGKRYFKRLFEEISNDIS